MTLRSSLPAMESALLHEKSSHCYCSATVLSLLSLEDAISVAQEVMHMCTADVCLTDGTAFLK